MAWELAYPIGALLFFFGAAWGFFQYKKRSAREVAITETATKELYEHPDRYERETRDALEEAADDEQRRQRQER